LDPHFVPHPKNAPGPFYVVNEACITCGLPLVAAPDLFPTGAELEQANHCYFKRQPSGDPEIGAAVEAVVTACCGSLRYGGTEASILELLRSKNGAQFCDHPLADQGV
jgi:hypothetical protein